MSYLHSLIPDTRKTNEKGVLLTDDGLLQVSISKRSGDNNPLDLKATFDGYAGLRAGDVFGRGRHLSAAAPEESIEKIKEFVEENGCLFGYNLKAETFGDTLNSLEGLGAPKP